MLRSLLGVLVFAAVSMCCREAQAQVPYKIVTASERGTYIQIGRDIAKFVAPGAGIDLTVLPSAGSAENVQRLRYEPGVKFAMVQSDVYQAFLDQDKSGNAEAGALIRPLRVIMPLYNEEIYFIARADSDLQFMHEIRNAKINVGPLLSGTAMSATTLYRMMFDAPIADANVSYLTNEEALVKLTGDKSVDVVVVVAGGAEDLLPGHGALVELPQAPGRRRARPRREGLPGHLRLRSRKHGLATAQVRSLAVPELRYAASLGAPEVARSRAGTTAARPGLGLLPADGA
jgi:hypothetical protein